MLEARPDILKWTAEVSANNLSFGSRLMLAALTPARFQCGGTAGRAASENEETRQNLSKGLSSVELDERQRGGLRRGSSRELIVACRYRTKLLEFSEETLDQVAFFVENEVAFPFVFAIALRRNDDGNSRIAQPFDQGVRITFVAEQRATSDAFEQLSLSANIVDVTGRQNKPDRIAQSIGGVTLVTA